MKGKERCRARAYHHMGIVRSYRADYFTSFHATPLITSGRYFLDIHEMTRE